VTRYRVTGTRAVAGHEPGSIFDAEFDERKEARLIAAGVIAKSRAQHVSDDDNDDDENEGGETNE
jgi:hypothetical protein